MVYSPHPYFPAAPDETVLWRYVDLYRLVDLLRTGELHMTRADSMEDRWEGASSAASIATRKERYGDQYDRVRESLPEMLRDMRTRTYLNCWYLGSEESYAMWRLYGAEGKGVAIRTTAGKLHAALRGTAAIMATPVKYVDYQATVIPDSNLIAQFTYKRLSFQHESEYRLIDCWFPEIIEETKDEVVRAPDIPPAFLRESIDLQFIDSIHVSPDAPSWAADTVADVVRLYRPDVVVKHSDLGDDPLY